MKKLILITTILFLSVTSSYSQGIAVLTGVFPGRNLSNFFDPCNSSTITAYAGVILCNFEGNANVPFYCLDLCTNINLGDSISDSAGTVPKAIYILQNYYPQVATYPGKLADNNDEAAAIQCAIWVIRNGLDINTSVGDLTVRNRAQLIVNDANANGGSSAIATTFSIIPGMNPNEFIVRTLDQNGNPIAVNNIQLSITSGSLSTNVTSTDGTGQSAPIVVSGTNNGLITATANVVNPAGFAFAGLSSNLQVLGLATTTTALRSVTADWGVLPVELSSFTANVTNAIVNLNWSTIFETNNSGFDIERKSVGSNDWQRIGFTEGHGTINVPTNYLYIDRNVNSGRYNYRLKQLDINGNFEYHNLISEIEIGAPTKFELRQNYPNPFNPSTTISFDLPLSGFVSLKVFNISGKEVATLVNESRSAGYHSVNFNASSLSSGVYYYRLEANGISKIMKMALIK